MLPLHLNASVLGAAGTLEGIHHQVVGEFCYLQKIKTSVKEGQQAMITLPLSKAALMFCPTCLWAVRGCSQPKNNTRQSTSWAVFEALANPVEGQLLRVELQTMSRVMRLSMGIDFATPYDDAATITSGEVDTDEVGPWSCVLHYWLLEHQLYNYPHLPTASPLSSFFQVQQDCSCCSELLE